uniref:Uncharacterized protein n=1 Tax=Heterorhabditis bacteriophora TaxID=37862 RepID=A0A1I7WV69_HETBA
MRATLMLTYTGSSMSMFFESHFDLDIHHLLFKIHLEDLVVLGWGERPNYVFPDEAIAYTDDSGPRNTYVTNTVSSLLQSDITAEAISYKKLRM